MFRKENAKTASFTPREDKKLYEAIADFKARCGKFTQLDWNRIRDISDLHRFNQKQLRERYHNLEKKAKNKRKSHVRSNESESSYDECDPAETESVSGDFLLNCWKVVSPLTLGSQDLLTQLQKHATRGWAITGEHYKRELTKAVRKMPKSWRQKIRSFDEPITACNINRFRKDMAAIGMRNRINGDIGTKSNSAKVLSRIRTDKSNRQEPCNKKIANSRRLGSNKARLSRPAPALDIFSRKPASGGSADSEEPSSSAGIVADSTSLSLFNQVLPIQNCDFHCLLPTPSGYGAQHVHRILSDNEWRKILSMDWFDFEREDVQAWKHLLERLQIVTSKEPGEVKLDFFKHAAPRVQLLMDWSTKKVHLDLEECSRFSMIVIFHATKKMEDIEKVLETLISNRTLSTQKTSKEAWRIEFAKSVLCEDHLYFRTTKQTLDERKQEVLVRALEHF